MRTCIKTEFGGLVPIYLRPTGIVDDPKLKEEVRLKNWASSKETSSTT